MRAETQHMVPVFRFLLCTIFLVVNVFFCINSAVVCHFIVCILTASLLGLLWENIQKSICCIRSNIIKIESDTNQKGVTRRHYCENIREKETQTAYQIIVGLFNIKSTRTCKLSPNNWLIFLQKLSALG